MSLRLAQTRELINCGHRVRARIVVALDGMHELEFAVSPALQSVVACRATIPFCVDRLGAAILAVVFSYLENQERRLRAAPALADHVYALATACEALERPAYRGALFAGVCHLYGVSADIVGALSRESRWSREVHSAYCDVPPHPRPPGTVRMRRRTASVAPLWLKETFF